MKRTASSKPIGRITNIAGLNEREREALAFGKDIVDRRCLHPQNLEHPLWNKVGDDIYMRDDGSFFLHHLIMDPTAITSGEIRGNVTIDMTRQQALAWWLRNYPQGDNEDICDYMRKFVPKELRAGLWDGVDLNQYLNLPD